MRSWRAVVGVLGLLGGVTAPAHAEDSDRVRYYLNLRGQDTNPVTETHDAWGIAAGANFGRHWGLELSADIYERMVEFDGKSIGEQAILALVPQVRFRYPLLDDRLVPYLIGGIGVGFSQFNDRKPRGFGLDVDHRDDSPFLVGTVGAGLEYFFADNMAVGAEVKYVMAGDREYRINGVRQDQDVDGVLTMLSLRLFTPELRPKPLAEARDPLPYRVYFGVRAGAAITTNDDSYSPLELRPEPSAFGDEGNRFVGAALGLAWGRHWAVEVAAEGYEVRVADPTLGSVTELAVVNIIPQVRFSYPLLGGRLVPYLIAGVGASYLEVNDRKPPGADLDLSVDSWGVAAAVGAGIDYFLASNIAAGLEARWMTARGHSIKVGDDERDGSVDAVVLALTLRAFLFDFGGR
jgi:opacity protein-like surface antigen